jgi:hypothetical protein
MRTEKSKPNAGHGQDESFKDRLIPFPRRSQDPLWPMLSHHLENPFVRFLRTVFFYENAPVHAAHPRVASGHYLHGKPIAH